MKRPTVLQIAGLFAITSIARHQPGQRDTGEGIIMDRRARSLGLVFLSVDLTKRIIGRRGWLVLVNIPLLAIGRVHGPAPACDGHRSGSRTTALIRTLDVVLFDDLAPPIGFRFDIGGECCGILYLRNKAENHQSLLDTGVLGRARERIVQARNALGGRIGRSNKCIPEPGREVGIAQLLHRRHIGKRRKTVVRGHGKDSNLARRD